MNLVSMKIGRASRPEMVRDEYGYGLCIHLNDDQCEALGITSPIEAGKVVNIQAKAFVKRAEQSVEDNGDDTGTDVALTLQITDMAMQESGKTSLQNLYSNSDMEP